MSRPQTRMSRPQTRMSRYKALCIDAYLDWTVSRELSMTWVDAYPKCVDAYHEWIDASVYVSMQKLMIHKSESLNTYESMQDAMHRCIYCLYRSMLLCIDAKHVFQQYLYAMYRCKERMSRLILKQNGFCEFSNGMSRCNAFCINSKPHYE